ALMVQREIDAQEGLTAASPSFEIARLLSYARPITVAVTGFGLLLMAIAAIAAALGLLATMSARTRDLALLRALGAGRASLSTVALCEAALIAAGALLLGVLIAAGLLWLAREVMQEQTGLLLQPMPEPIHIALLLGGTILATLLAAAIP